MTNAPRYKTLRRVINILSLHERFAEYKIFISDICVEGDHQLGDIESSLEFLTFAGKLVWDGSERVRFVEPSRWRNCTSIQISNELAHSFIDWLKQAELLEKFLRAIQYSMNSSALYLDHRLLPWKLSSHRDLMLRLGILEREQAFQSHWKISDLATASFEEEMVENLQIPMDGSSLTPDQLKNKLALNEVQGQLAEEWVLKYELSRLANHPLRKHISQVSTINVAAGYDIASFADESSTAFDHFLEVKSFANDLHFYWSSNEIATARALGEKYCLVLVDRSRINQEGYTPRKIVDPYTHYFEGNHQDWIVEPENWHIRKGSY